MEDEVLEFAVELFGGADWPPFWVSGGDATPIHAIDKSLDALVATIERVEVDEGLGRRHNLVVLDNRFRARLGTVDLFFEEFDVVSASTS